MENGFLEFRAKCLSSDLCNGSNPMSSSVSLRQDLVLIRSCPSSSHGHPTPHPNPHPHPPAPHGKSNDKKKPPDSSSKTFTGDDSSLTNNLKTIHRKITSPSPAPPHRPSPQAKAMKNEETYREIEQIFHKKLNEIKKLKQDLQQSNEQESSYLKIILQMPNVHRSLFFLVKISHRFKKEKRFRVWKEKISQWKDFESQKIRQQKKIWIQTQRLWRESIAREHLYSRRERKAQEQQIRFETAAHLIQKIFFFYRKNKERFERRSRRLEQERRFRRESEEIVKIQKAYRGWRGRCLYCDQWRVHLLQEMRLWANGNVQKLLERSSMQDPRVYQALLKAIAICSHHSRPLRLLPSLAIIKQSYAVRLCRHFLFSLFSPLLSLPVDEKETTPRRKGSTVTCQ